MNTRTNPPNTNSLPKAKKSRSPSKEKGLAPRQFKKSSPNSKDAWQVAAQSIEMDVPELKRWLSQYANLSTNALENTLRLISQHALDPRADEIELVHYDHHGWQILITVNGWAKLINTQATFCGIEFTESAELHNDIPIWMSCSIYRTDRIKPITVKEYFREVQTEHSCWLEMPRRMLRHRVMQQCARLAFGITVPECKPKPADTNTKNLPQRTDPIQRKDFRRGDVLKELLLKTIPS